MLLLYGVFVFYVFAWLASYLLFSALPSLVLPKHHLLPDQAKVCPFLPIPYISSPSNYKILFSYSDCCEQIHLPVGFLGPQIFFEFWKGEVWPRCLLPYLQYILLNAHSWHVTKICEISKWSDTFKVMGRNKKTLYALLPVLWFSFAFPAPSPSSSPYLSLPHSFSLSPCLLLFPTLQFCVHMCLHVCGHQWSSLKCHPSCFLRQVLSLACNVPGRLTGWSQGSVCLCLSSTAVTGVSPTPWFLFSLWLLGWNLGPLVCRTGTLPTKLSFQASVCLSAYHGVCPTLSLSEAHLQTSFQVSPSSCAVWWPAGGSSWRWFGW